MLVSSLLSPATVATGLSLESKQEVLERLVSLAATFGTVVNRSAALTALLEREGLCSTAIGHGIAIPHATQPLPGVFKGVALSVVRLERGLDLDAPDGEPVRLFVLMGTDDRKQHLQVLGRLARLFRCDQLRAELMQAPTSEAFTDSLAKADNALNRLNGTLSSP
ncbi:PTS sugar transporter subunit IIA [Candidatus Fermentibacteria bacterium]|nr:PTS sugar transporter subunit IIA [Candidatus Fermentibacteria bacterium]